MRVKVVYIISSIDKALAFEWIANSTIKKNIDLSFILLNPKDSILEEYLLFIGVKVLRIEYHSKKNLPLAFLKIFWYLIKNKITVVHCHLFDACMAGMTAAWFARVPKRIYTRHYSTNHHVYYPNAVKYDKYINALSTNIIAISEKVKNVLIDLEGVKSSKIEVIHHGFEFYEFENISKENQSLMKLKYGIDTQWPVVGVISRYVELKGLQYIIPAFAEIKKKYPEALLLLANCNGDYKTTVQTMLSEYVDESCYREIVFESDLATLYSLMDVFVHVPIDDTIEAFGQTYIEALIAGVPSVFTLSGVASEFIENGKNAIVVDYKNSEQISVAIDQILTNISLKDNLIKNGKESIFDKFSLNLYIDKLKELYVR